ncbi:hypothetical protein GCM10011390_03900 [Aureimonas endophytica]|uniref:Uncharacterized protein n=2 Tax=Aureimonas endophytica TaxID=2027858 RepID=A0A916ZDC8_9HYPH|nr:hypothetical protein GCM10011390_03900 [Aureimonas endophytica]
MTFLGAWAGFFGTLSAIASLAIVAAAYPTLPPVPLIGDEVTRIAVLVLSQGSATVFGGAIAGFACAVLTLLLLLSMWMLQGAAPTDRAAGERLALATLGLAALLLGLAWAAGLDILGENVTLPGIATVLGLSSLALVFDRLVESEGSGEGDSEEEFYRSALLVGREMAREVTLRPVPTIHRRDREL